MLYELLRNSREYFIKDQILRAAVSIASNIAEGSERRTRADFNRFLSIAKGSAAELRTQIYLSHCIGLLREDDAAAIIKELKEISRMLQGLSSSILRILSIMSTDNYQL
jgi:four helix bundle protein